MVKPGSCAGFAVEAGKRRRVFGLGDRQHFEGDAPAHVLMFSEINRAHAAGAETVDEAILAGDDETTPASVEQLLGLKAGEDAVFDQGIRIFAWGSGFGFVVGAKRFNRLGIQDAALVADFQECIDSGWRRHVPYPCRLKIGQEGP
ncbi:MAG: hypothetical protein U0744_06865 [Gemmataceae bacterium]